MNKKILKRIASYIKPYKKLLFFALISTIISIGLQIIVPLLIGKAIDNIIGVGNVDFKNITKISCILIAIIIISSIFNRIMIYITNKLSFYTVRDIRADAFKKLNTTEISYIDNNSHGDIMSKIINDSEQLADGLLQGIVQLLSSVITIFGTLGLMLSLNAKISALVIVMTPLSLAVAYFITRKSHTYFRNLTTTRGELSGFAEEIFSNQKTLKTLTTEKDTKTDFETKNKNFYKSIYKAQLLAAFINPSTRFVNGLVFAGVGILGAVLTIQGELSVGELSCFFAYSQQYTKPFNELSGVFAELQSAITAGERIFNLIDIPDEIETGNIENIESNGNITIDNVDFSYYPNSKLIENLNLTVKSGKKVAIVGPTGSGKTTLINLLMRFYDINQGKILIDSYNTNDLTRDAVRNCYGMVLQDAWIFNGTIRNNIKYGKPDATDYEVIKAAKSAHIHDYIMHLEKGYDTIIYEDGDNISEGQKQLLCIARIMLTSPPMLILDEATSNIDTLTEIEIQKSFKKIMKGRTSFIVAHRLSTIKEADIILVMKDGKIIEQGTHKELLAKNGFYTKLYNAQF